VLTFNNTPPLGKLLKEKRGLGDCPQGFDFVFEFKQKASLPYGGLGAKPPRFWFLPEGHYKQDALQAKKQNQNPGAAPLDPPWGAVKSKI